MLRSAYVWVSGRGQDDRKLSFSTSLSYLFLQKITQSTGMSKLVVLSVYFQRLSFNANRILRSFYFLSISSFWLCSCLDFKLQYRQIMLYAWKKFYSQTNIKTVCLAYRPCLWGALVFSHHYSPLEFPMAALSKCSPQPQALIAGSKLFRIKKNSLATSPTKLFILFTGFDRPVLIYLYTCFYHTSSGLIIWLSTGQRGWTPTWHLFIL